MVGAGDDDVFRVEVMTVEDLHQPEDRPVPSDDLFLVRGWWPLALDELVPGVSGPHQHRANVKGRFEAALVQRGAQIHEAARDREVLGFVDEAAPGAKAQDRDRAPPVVNITRVAAEAVDLPIAVVDQAEIDQIAPVGRESGDHFFQSIAPGEERLGHGAGERGVRSGQRDAVESCVRAVVGAPDGDEGAAHVHGDVIDGEGQREAGAGSGRGLD
jgi:hypothetical protein